MPSAKKIPENTEIATDEDFSETAISGHNPEEELVEITLFWDGDKYKDDVYVCVNGKNILIQRGKPVMIPRKYLNVLEDSARQDKETLRIIQGYRDQYRDMSKAFS